MPPDIDEQGFWEDHFSAVIDKQHPGRHAFLLPVADRPRVRRLLRDVGVEQLQETEVLDLMEKTVASPQPAAWWYSCYGYLANSREVSRWSHGSFVGRQLIPLADGTTNAVTDEQGRIVCLPPSFDASQLTVPRLFDEVFVWMDRELAALLDQGDPRLRTWLLDRLALARFEATDLLPRAMRSVVPQIFNGKQEVTLLGLRRAWLFIKRIVDASRVSIGSAVFWQEIGRFPVLLATATSHHEIANMRPEHLAPAFLTYFPDGFGESSALRGVDSLARVEKGFLEKLVTESKQPQDEWIGFFRQAGVSSGPKILKYGRIVGRGDEVPLNSEALASQRVSRYSGERQTDENQTVLDILRNDGLWIEVVSDARACSHNALKVLHALNAIHGLRQATELAQKEFLAGDENWRARLWSLTREIDPGREPRAPDQMYCRGGISGGHMVPVGKYIDRQLDRFRWLPSSLGPASSGKCFFRRSGYSLISSGRTGDDFGDVVLPYVEAKDVETTACLERLGIVELGSAAAAKSSTLERALQNLGDRMSTTWAVQEILSNRGRWRLVRGALQEIYRILNQRDDSLSLGPELKLATRGSDGVVFRSRPIYFADPGSQLEQAYRESLALLDADRPYPKLFQRLGVIRLIPGDTVVEEFLDEASSEPAKGLQMDIVERLAPYLLASILAKSDRANQRDIILRRLQERVAVRAAGKLTVSYLLKNSQTERRLIEFPKFYLQRRIERSQGAIQEASFTLYVEGKSAPPSIFDTAIDSDALGAALVPIFLDDPSEEVSSLFPRITSRFCHVRGNPTDMREFMYRQLGVSCEALENAEVLVSGSEEPSQPVTEPPVIVVARPMLSKQEIAEDIKQMLDGHQATLTDAVTRVVTSFTGTSSGSGRGVGRVNIGGITPEQEERGDWARKKSSGDYPELKDGKASTS